jgi:class 3 adenylate cyclase/tetratricopeptide (TPR) repeat protein
VDRPGRADGGAPITVLFTDIEGSTDLRNRLGDDLAQETLGVHDELVRAALSEHGGQEIKALGDGFMVAFASPRRALACAQAIHRAISRARWPAPQATVRLRIGVNTGEVVEHGGDLFGQAVHAAARIAAKAQGGEILVSDVTRTLVGAAPEFVFSDRGRFRLKGFDERWRLFELAWSTPDQAGTVTPAFLGGRRDRPPFVGRAAERAKLSVALEQARSGSGGIVLIGGEPGIGKTRLAEELAAEAARAGLAVLAGHSYEMAGASAYVAFVEILEGALAAAENPETFLNNVLGDSAPEVARLVPRLRRLFPDLPAPLDLPPDQERQYLFTCLSDVFGRMATMRPTVVLLDDLQWADETTLLFIEYFAPRLSGLQMLIVATYRDVEAGRPLSRTFEDLHRRRLAQRINLAGMSEAEAAQLIGVLAGHEAPPPLVQALHAGTEGNPFFLEEVFRDLVERGRLFDPEGGIRDHIDVAALDVPEGVRLVIGRRLERLSDDAQQLLVVAAVAGRVFSFRLLQALGDWHADRILDVVDEAEAAMLVREGPGDDEFLFAHELIRQTLSAGLSAPRRRRAHLQAAAAMTQVWAGNLEEHAAEIAHHLAQAGDDADPKELLSYALLAGQRALDTSAFEEALRHLQRAAGLEPIATPRQRAELLFALGSCHSRTGEWDVALTAWQRSLEDYESLDDQEAIGRTCLEVGFNLAWANRIPEALAMYQRGLTALGDAVTADRTRLLARMATFVAFGGDVAASDAMFGEARRLADELTDPGLQGFVLGEMACASHASMRFNDGLTAGRQGGELMRKAGDLWGAATALGFVEVFSVHTGRFGDALAVGTEMVPVAERIGNQPALYLDGRAQGMLAFFRDGDLDALEAFARWDADFAERAGGAWIGHSYTWLGLAAFLRGDWDAAGEWFRRGLDHAPAIAPGFCWSAWFQYLVFAGRTREALEFVDQKRNLLPKSGQPNMWDAWTLLFAFTEGLFVLGQREQPAGWYPLIVEARATGAVTTDNIFGRLLERVAAIAATTAGNWDAAETHFLLALRQADELPHQLERLETRRFYAQMLLERASPGDPDRARRLLHEASEGFSRLGMPRHAELAQSALVTMTP